MVQVLPSLECLPFLSLQIFLIQFRVSCVGRRGAFPGWKIVGMNDGVWPGRTTRRVRCSCGTLAGRMIRRSRGRGRHCSAVPECTRFRSGCYWRPAQVRRSAQLRIGAGSLHMLSLSRHRWKVSLVRDGQFFGRGARVDSAFAAIEANAVHRNILGGRGFVNVVNEGDIHVVDYHVVIEMPVLPMASFVPSAEVAEAVNDASIETLFRGPKFILKKQNRCRPKPNRVGPQQADLRGQYPCARCRTRTSQD
jgi:hypothetical protein